MGELEIRGMRPEEAGEAAALEAECFPDPWSAQALRDMTANPRAVCIAALEGGRLVGYCSAQTVLDEGEILRVAVGIPFRGRGIGSALLERMLEHTPGIVSWYLEVRESNEPALALYRRSGFEAVGRRKAYYHHPTEDAVLMQRNRKEN